MTATPRDWKQQASCRILEHTKVASPWLCPEIRLRLATPETRLWRASEQEAEQLGIVDPYWAFCWPGGQAIARWLLDGGAILRGLRVLDFGCGGGVVAIAAALRGAQVVACDIDPMAALAAELNAELNGVRVEATSRPHLGSSNAWDLVTVGDVTYDPSLSERVLSWLRRLAADRTPVLIADPRRGYLDTQALAFVASYSAPGDNDVCGNHLVTTDIYSVPTV